MDRIAQAFATARNEGRSCFVSYICAGDPDFDTSVEVCRTLAEGGVDIMEMGVPFSDPLADGVPNQLAAQRALESGMTQQKALELVKEVREFTEKPIIFYTYYNMVFSQGVENYVKRVKEAGVDGLLTLDLPPEEASELIEACRKHDVKNIFIIAPTTPPERLKVINDVASGFLYYVSLEGVTGERETLAENLEEALKTIKSHTSLPTVVGFGISTPEHVRTVASIADGAVVGSALVNCIGENTNDKKLALKKLAEKLEYLVSGIKASG